jgi:hypothetical protein
MSSSTVPVKCFTKFDGTSTVLVRYEARTDIDTGKTPNNYGYRTRTVTAVVFNSTSTVRYEYGSCKNYRAVRVQYGTRTRTVRVLVPLLVSLLDASILQKFLVYVIWNDTEKISSARWSEARAARLVYTIGLFCTTFYISPTKKSFAHAHA